jgi:uncharacterized membrane protein
MLSFFQQKNFLSKAEATHIIDAIRAAEKNTSGEIRVFIESRCKFVDPVDRAAEIFFTLKMNQTNARNGVLVYVATKDKQLAVFGDSGIHDRLPARHWENCIADMMTAFGGNAYAAGIADCIHRIGQALQKEFPYAYADKNELPDDIIFGK